MLMDMTIYAALSFKDYSILQITRLFN